VNQQSPSRLEPNNQILATAIDGQHTFILELAGGLERVVWSRQARICDLDALETAALEERRKPAADGLDLGQFGHARTVAAALETEARPTNWRPTS
jgi:hypothetical protein